MNHMEFKKYRNFEYSFVSPHLQCSKSGALSAANLPAHTHRCASWLVDCGWPWLIELVKRGGQLCSWAPGRLAVRGRLCFEGEENGSVTARSCRAVTPWPLQTRSAQSAHCAALVPPAETAETKERGTSPRPSLPGCLDNSEAPSVPPGASQLAWRVEIRQDSESWAIRCVSGGGDVIHDISVIKKFYNVLPHT